MQTEDGEVTSEWTTQGIEGAVRYRQKGMVEHVAADVECEFWGNWCGRTGQIDSSLW